MRESECMVCPSWVIRCAHYEDQRVILGDQVAAAHLHGHPPRLGAWTTSPQYTVYTPSDDSWYKCACGLDMIMADTRFASNDLSATQEHFGHSELQLLGREDGQD